jgi:hypothetical protein
MNDVSRPSSSSVGRPHLLRLPLELFLLIFSFADRRTLFALRSTSLTFYEFVTPDLYRTAHFDDLPHPSSLPIDPLAKRLLDLALNSVQTLHLTLPRRKSTQRTFAIIYLPNLQHLFIHHSETTDCTLLSLSCCADFLSSLDPLSLTFSLSSASRSRYWDAWELDTLHTRSWTAGWGRLEDIVFRGGILYEPHIPSTEYNPKDVVALAGNLDERPLGTSPPRVTYDVRTVGKAGLDASNWPGDLYGFNPTDWPNVKSIIQTLTEETRAWLEEELVWLEEVYRSRVEIRLEDKAEGEAVLADMGFWRGGGLSEL